MAEFDQSGNITMVRVDVPSFKDWAIYRSNDVADALGVKRYLDGDVDEI